MKQSNAEIEACRITWGRMASDASYGMNGGFIVPGPRGIKLICLVSDKGGFEHVSVERGKPGDKIATKVPYWDELCFIKDFFWQPEETVIQYHPAHSVYVNIHPGVLHLWKCIDQPFPVPPIWMV